MKYLLSYYCSRFLRKRVHFAEKRTISNGRNEQR